MLHFEPDQELAPLSMEELIEKSNQLTPEKLKSICQNFMLPEHNLGTLLPMVFIISLSWEGSS